MSGDVQQQQPEAHIGGYHLVPGVPFSKIMKGRQWVGRVAQHVEGYYLGVIGTSMLKAPTAVKAFEEIVARHLGYGNAGQMRSVTSTSRKQNRRTKAFVRLVEAAPIQDNPVPLEVVTGLPVRKRFNPNSEAR